MLLTAQVQAAETYQEQGAVDGKGYALAINGSTPGKDNKNVIWGWRTISRMAMQDFTKFEDTFHQARLKMAEARLAVAATLKEDKARENLLKVAEHDLFITYKQPRTRRPKNRGRIRSAAQAGSKKSGQGRTRPGRIQRTRSRRGHRRAGEINPAGRAK